MQKYEQCICGNNTIHGSDTESETATYTYCCNAESLPCRREKEKIICEKGTVINITEKCFGECQFSRCKSLVTIFRYYGLNSPASLKVDPLWLNGQLIL